MQEITISPGQYLNLTAQGAPNTQLLVQNQGPNVMYLIKSSTPPSNNNPSFDVKAGEDCTIDNTSGDWWVSTVQTGRLFVTPSTEIFSSGSSIPLDLYTSTTEGFRRLRVDSEQTSFFAGREFRTFYEFNIPANNVQTIKFNSPIDFILWEQNLELDAGSIRLEVFTGTVTEIATFNIALPKVGKNRMISRQQPYYTSVINATTHSAPVALGNSINVTSATQTDKLRLVAANATAQQQSVSGGAQSERGIPPGSYYIRLHNFGSGAATGTYSVIWEERP
jgi:hypothetical protein